MAERFGMVWQEARLGRIWQTLTGFAIIGQDFARFGKLERFGNRKDPTSGDIRRKMWHDLTKICQDLPELGEIWQDFATFGKIWQARRFPSWGILEHLGGDFARFGQWGGVLG